MKSPAFSIVMPHYEGSIPHDRFIQAVSSIKAQSYPLWHLDIYHDGPEISNQLKEYVQTICVDPRIKFKATRQRYNDWGHSLRDIGIHEAKGDYVFVMNSDNVLYQNALAILAAYSLWPKTEIKRKDRSGQLSIHISNPEVLVFGLKMMGMLFDFTNNRITRTRGAEEHYQMILPGWPPKKYFIDAMQLVAKTSLWQKHGGWWLKTEESDGEIIEKITRSEGCLIIPEVMGEHW